MNTQEFCEEIKKGNLKALGINETDAETYRRLYPQYFR